VVAVFSAYTSALAKEEIDCFRAVQEVERERERTRENEGERGRTRENEREKREKREKEEREKKRRRHEFSLSLFSRCVVQSKFKIQQKKIFKKNIF